MDALEMLESEHRDIEALLAKVDKAKGTRARHLIQELKDRVDLIEQLEEETQLFPRVRLIWDDDKRRHLYRKMEQLKARIKKAREVGLLPA